jgi:hypothetical protein
MRALSRSIRLKMTTPIVTSGRQCLRSATAATVTRRASALLAGLALVGAAACGSGTRAPDARASGVIADSLTRLVRAAYDFSRPGVVERLTSLYPDSGRVVSAAAGRVTTTRAALDDQVRRFWENVGQNMQAPRFTLQAVHADVLTADAAVLTMTYSIPHRTPGDRPHTIGGAWTALFVRRGDRWVIVQEHLSDAPSRVGAP